MAGYSTCAICGRKKSLGILSSGTWGSVSTSETTVQVCPTCMSEHADWQSRLRATGGDAGATGGSPELSPQT
jgi:hypothetical protein